MPNQRPENHQNQTQVAPPTLIPRPETEELVEWVLQEVVVMAARKQAEVEGQGGLRFLDVGSGTGAIGLALLKARGAGTIVYGYTSTRILLSPDGQARSRTQHKHTHTTDRPCHPRSPPTASAWASIRTPQPSPSPAVTPPRSGWARRSTGSSKGGSRRPPPCTYDDEGLS